MIHPQERKALADAIDNFESAYVDLVQAGRRILRLLDADGEPPRAPPPEPVGSPELVLPSGQVDLRPRDPTLHGYTGGQCNVCGSVKMVRTGTCITCLDCGANEGCG